ncbi:MAG TPA: type II CAAX endopeptidase family protein [Polyangiaceae bacterium]|nr:type II CAAX endopeptidase family protein [Polyangiaceae bacterium]
MRRDVPPAPTWHTAALVTLIVVVAVAGSALAANGATAPIPTASSARVASVYLPVLLVQWGLVLYVCRIGRTRNVLRELLGETWSGPTRAAVDVTLAAMTVCLILGVNAAYTHLLGSAHAASREALLPRTAFERGVWVFVAISVGFCEEVVYRGYLLSALSRWSRSVTLGVISQGVLFGLAHLDQGARAAIPIVFYGVLLGTLSRFRGSLMAGILCHVTVDLLSGLASTG